MAQIQRDAAAVLQPYFTSTGLVIKALEHASKMEHIMDFTRLRCLGSLFSMLHQACRNVALYNNNHPDFPMPIDQLERYMQVMFCLLIFTCRQDLNAIYGIKDICVDQALVFTRKINMSNLYCTEVSDLCRAVVLLW